MADEKQSGIPIADVLIEEVARAAHPGLEALVHQFCDEAYRSIMESVQDYLVDNTQFNIGAEISSLKRENAGLRQELFQIDQALRRSSWQQERVAMIADLMDRQRRYSELLYAVAKKFVGEDRHQTALRYIREREASAIEVAEPSMPQASTEGESAAPEGGDAHD